jgi:hypothetical protein
MNRKEIECFEKVFAQLLSLHQEVSVLVKKDPDGAMNRFKLQLINKVISNANSLLMENKPFDDFECFDIDGDMPFNSDVALILGQYIHCMELIRKDNVHVYSGRWYWNVDGDTHINDMRTTDPIDKKK